MKEGKKNEEEKGGMKRGKEPGGKKQRKGGIGNSKGMVSGRRMRSEMRRKGRKQYPYSK